MTTTAVLFVGGESRRMGADKASLTIAGEPLWRRQLELLRKLRAEELWISARVRPEWCPAEMDVVLDEAPSRGPLSGLAAALKKLRTSHLLALAIDLPNMTADHLDKLRALAEPGCGVIPVNGTFFEPLVAIYPVETRMAAISSPADASLQRLARDLVREKRAKPYAVLPEERTLYHNWNTPADAAGVHGPR
jgi:molybdopterin-guanine dinucleotide biosynthesis protein A